eukprot:6456081-Amphidinium_carterae.2
MGGKGKTKGTKNKDAQPSNPEDDFCQGYCTVTLLQSALPASAARRLDAKLDQAEWSIPVTAAL